MIWWLLYWLPGIEGGSAPTPVPLPYLRRDGANLGALPAIVRRSS